jgi:HD-GYP domain-containing protein (c-di-GMP phosphodiesterase class II)
MRDLPIGARLYVAAVIVTGAVIVLFDVLRLEQWGYALALMSLVLVATRLTTPLRRAVVDDAVVSISIDMPIGIASVLILGPAGAPLVLAASAFMPGPKKLPLVKRLFNGGMLAIIAWVAAVVYLALGGQLVNAAWEFSLQNVIATLVATLAMEAVNGLLLVMVIALTERVSPLRVWFGTMAESAFPLFIYSTFGFLIAVVWSFAGPVSAVLVLAPLMVARWVFAQFAARQAAYEATMRSLIKAVETKDLYTRGHSERVSRASVLIGRSAGMREDRVTTLRYAGTLHDVGKLGVPTRVLQKAGKLTDEEYEAIQQHPSRGREITRELEFLGEAIEGIHFHHERIDGRGYPMGLKGEEIPEFARIIAVADAFDSMTTTRSYRGARSIEDAIIELRRCKGSQFDPVMVEALIEAIEAHGWDVTDTLPEIAPAPSASSMPSFGSDDDDPTAGARLGLVVPDDASELDGVSETAGEGQ